MRPVGLGRHIGEGGAGAVFTVWLGLGLGLHVDVGAGGVPAEGLEIVIGLFPHVDVGLAVAGVFHRLVQRLHRIEGGVLAHAHGGADVVHVLDDAAGAVLVVHRAVVADGGVGAHPHLPAGVDELEEILIGELVLHLHAGLGAQKLGHALAFLGGEGAVVPGVIIAVDDLAQKVVAQDLLGGLGVTVDDGLQKVERLAAVPLDKADAQSVAVVAGDGGVVALHQEHEIPHGGQDPILMQALVFRRRGEGHHGQAQRQHQKQRDHSTFHG